MRKGLTYADVCIEPVYNNLESRSAPTLKTKLCLGMETGIPFIPANMDTVIGDELAMVIEDYGGIPIFHRFTDFDTKVGWINKFEGCFISSGIKEADIKEALHLVDLGLTGSNIGMAVNGRSLVLLSTNFAFLEPYMNLRLFGLVRTTNLP